MGRTSSLSKQALILSCCLFSFSTVHAASDKWNNEVSKEVRSKLADNPTTTYRTLDTKDAYIPPNNTTDVAVKSKYTDAYIKNGTKAGVVIEGVETRLSKSQIAKVMASRYAQFGAKAIAGASLPYAVSTAVDLLLDGVDYVMGEGGKIQMKPSNKTVECTSTGLGCEGSEYIYKSNNGRYFSDNSNSACWELLGKSDWWGNTISVDNTSETLCMNESKDRLLAYLWKQNNPSYDSTKVNKPTDVTPSQLKDAIEQKLNDKNTDQEKVKAAAKSAANYVDKNGNKTNNANEADTTNGVNDAAKQVEKNARDQIKDDANPTGSKSVTSGSDGKNDSDTKTDTTIKDKDGNTTGSTTGTDTSTGNFQLPAFCDWAATMCQWYKEWKETDDWLKKDDSEIDKDTELDIEQPEQPPDTTINFGGSCPSPQPIPIQFGSIKGTYDPSNFYVWLCQVASFIKPVVISIAAFFAALIVAGVKTEE